MMNIRIIQRVFRVTQHFSCVTMTCGPDALDGDNVRHGLNRDLGFTDADRVENNPPGGREGEADARRRVHRAGLVHLSVPSGARYGSADGDEEEFVEIFVDTTLAVCESRDLKGLYSRAREIKNFTGLDCPTKRPRTPGPDWTPRTSHSKRRRG